jgi:hypothetical protein
MMKILSSVQFFLCIVFLAISGCSDNPSSLGISLIPEEDYLKLDTLSIYSTTAHSYISPRNLGSSPTIAIGRTGSYEAYSLISFSSIPDTMDSATVNSVELTLFPNYIAGDSTGTVSFDIHEISSGWSESGFIWDSLSTLSYEGTVVGSYTGSVSDSDSIVVSIAPELISKWFRNSAYLDPIYGLLLKPNSPSGAGTVIRGFGSSEATRVPRLRIIATKNSVIDTFTLYILYDTDVIYGPAVVNPQKSIYVHPTLSYNSLLVFDVSALPRNALIHEAMLELTRDPNYSFYSRPAIDSVMAVFIIDSTGRSDLYGSSPPVSTRTGNVYSLNIAEMVQRWTKGFPNQGLRIKAYDDYTGPTAYGTLNPFVFYSSSADVSLRPRLKIFYSTIR